MVQIVHLRDDFSEWKTLLALLRDAFAYMAPRIDPPSSLNRMGLAELCEKASEETPILAYLDTELVGCVFAKPLPSVLYIGKMAVRSDCRGQGIARRLIEEAEKLAKSKGLNALELQTRVELVENHKTFAACGFRQVGQTAHPGYARPTSITMRRPVGPDTV